MSLEAGRTPVPAADFLDSGEYDYVDSGEYGYAGSGEYDSADHSANQDGQRIRYEPDATSRWSRSNSLMYFLRVVLT